MIFKPTLRYHRIIDRVTHKTCEFSPRKCLLLLLECFRVRLDFLRNVRLKTLVVGKMLAGWNIGTRTFERLIFQSRVLEQSLSSDCLDLSHRNEFGSWDVAEIAVGAIKECRWTQVIEAERTLDLLFFHLAFLYGVFGFIQIFLSLSFHFCH